MADKHERLAWLGVGGPGRKEAGLAHLGRVAWATDHSHSLPCLQGQAAGPHFLVLGATYGEHAQYMRNVRSAAYQGLPARPAACGVASAEACQDGLHTRAATYTWRSDQELRLGVWVASWQAGGRAASTGEARSVWPLLVSTIGAHLRGKLGGSGAYPEGAALAVRRAHDNLVVCLHNLPPQELEDQVVRRVEGLTLGLAGHGARE
jgi:hypothetical protein